MRIGWKVPVVALALANSPAAGWWATLWHTHVSVEIGRFVLGGELGHFFVNDVLMTVFFFVVVFAGGGAADAAAAACCAAAI